MATDHDTPTTPALPGARARPLVIPHVLTPDELAGLLRIGDALADIPARLAAMMGRPGGPLPAELRQLAVIAIDLLDVVTPDPDLEPDADDERTANERHGQGFTAAGGFPDDRGRQRRRRALARRSRLRRAHGTAILNASDVYSDRTSSQARWGAGSRQDLEAEHDGREPSLCGLTVGSGDDGDREGEHDGVEPDPDDAEPWHGPPRLDVFAEPLPASPEFLPTPVIERHTRD